MPPAAGSSRVAHHAGERIPARLRRAGRIAAASIKARAVEFRAKPDDEAGVSKSTDALIIDDEARVRLFLKLVLAESGIARSSRCKRTGPNWSCLI